MENFGVVSYDLLKNSVPTLDNRAILSHEALTEDVELAEDLEAGAVTAAVTERVTTGGTKVAALR